MAHTTKTYSRATNPRNQHRDHYEEVTSKIVAALEAGTKPWQKPWDPSKAGTVASPVNAITGRRYRGINILMLGLSPLSFETSDPRWCSYKQASERGWQVRRGETGTTIFFFKKLAVGERNSTSDDNRAQSDDGTTRFVPLLRAFTVFHASQIDGIPALPPPEKVKPLFERIEAADLVMKNSGAEIRIGGDRASYCPTTDHIRLPPDFTFRSPEDFAATALHELVHWSGAPHRLHRKLGSSFGSQDYAREELRAEIASALIGSVLGLPSDLEGHASYLASWIEVLRSDKREIFRAAADAQKIADYLLTFHPDFAADTATLDGTETAGADPAHEPVAEAA